MTAVVLTFQLTCAALPVSCLPLLVARSKARKDRLWRQTARRQKIQRADKKKMDSNA